MITLYDYELSGNCYKLRLLLSFLKIEYKTVPVEFYPGREHKSEWFLRINPLGQLPVIDDDGFMLRDAQAILVYLASRYDPTGRWYPSDPKLLGEIGPPARAAIPALSRLVQQKGDVGSAAEDAIKKIGS